ncbi:MAG: hypothetical protein H6741_22000 [Alphaproteobacteria bacterium]|nr:hypothetical protein [Alphaproteobacteria bacterium]MCB9795386.1 hypothetical protein [Alphaproteobacteria bacterium]
MSFRLTHLVPTTLLALSMVACAPAQVDKGLHDEVQQGDDPDTNPSDDGTGDSDPELYTTWVQGRIGQDAQAFNFSGEGSLSSITHVQLMRVGEGGALELMSEAEVDAEGRYSLDAPEGQDRMVLQGVDAAGEVMAWAILEATAEREDGEVTATPLDRESSAEAAVFLEMLAQGHEAHEVNTNDLRARVDAQVAAALYAAAERGEDTRGMISALAEAVAAAQASEEASWAESGADTTQSAAFWIELRAAQALNASLDRGQGAEAAARAYIEAMIEAHAEDGRSDQTQAEAEAMASAALDLVLEAREDAESEGDDAVYEAAVLASAEISAILTGRYTQEEAEDSEADAQELDLIAELVAELEARVEGAQDEAEVDEAYGDFEAELFGEGSLVAEILDVDLASMALFHGLVDGADEARREFEAWSRAEVMSYAESHEGAQFDAHAVADILIEAREGYEGQVWTSARLSSLLQSEDDSALFVDLYVMCSVSYSAER